MLHHFDPEDFLNNYWQKKPLLIRQGLAGFSSPLSPDEMAGLACEEAIESRIIIGSNDQFTAENGPFEEQRFQQLPEKNWTLLLQAVDHYIPEVAELLESFRFIPNWRLDDIMVSYAVTGGSVGKHFDNYDVFLIQGAGRRKWSVGQRCDSNSPKLKNEQLRLLADFDQEQEWVLEPGDILYLPPCYAHWGVSQDDDCITYSVGFRAPSHGDLLSDFCDYLLPQLSDELRYQDPDIELQNNPGEINEQALEQVQHILTTHLNNPNNIREWFGRYMTTAKYENITEETIPFSPAELRTVLAQSNLVIRNASSRFAFTDTQHTAILFVNGEHYHCHQKLAHWLSSNTYFSASEMLSVLSSPENENTVVTLFNQGSLYVESDDDD